MLRNLYGMTLLLVVLGTIGCGHSTATTSPGAPRFPAFVLPLDGPPVPIFRVAPVYPDLAREAGVEGTVVLLTQVDEHGGVAGMRAVHSIPMLDDAAKDAVGQWKFRPATRLRHPVAASIEIPVRFSLH